MSTIIINNTISNCGGGIRVRSISDPDLLISGNQIHDIRGKALDIEILTEKFPILEKADPSDIAEAATLLAKTNEQQREHRLKDTRLGRWLASQSFVAWASLAAALAG